MKIGIVASRKIIGERKKGANEIGIGIRIIGIAHFSSTIGNRILNYQLLETALNAMAMIGIIDEIDTIKTMIDDSMGRLEEELVEMANARVPDEFIFCRDANTYRVESREIHNQSVRQPQLPQWCPEGLTRTQKRRMQRER